MSVEPASQAVENARTRPFLIEWSGVSDRGCEREINEDSWTCDHYRTEAGEGWLAAVADGMGGAAGGERASALAVEVIQRVYAGTDHEDVETRLLAAFGEAHSTIRREAQRDPALHGMGTTATALAIENGQAYFAHVGDSRLYLIRGALLFQITRDQTALNQAVDAGRITSEEAARHPDQHVLSQALGASEEVRAEVSQAPIPIESGDVFVLCTDGLWSLLTEQEISRAADEQAAAVAVSMLVETAKRRGAPDNVTALLLRLTRDAV